MRPIRFPLSAGAFDSDDLVISRDLLYGGPGGLFLSGNGYAFGGDVDFDIAAGGNGQYIDIWFGVHDCTTAPAIDTFAVYSDRYLKGGWLGIAAGLVTAFHPFATVQTDGLTFDCPFHLANFDLFARLDLQLDVLFDLVSSLTAYIEFGVVPVWVDDAFTTTTRWAFGFHFQWTDVFEPPVRKPSLQ